MRIFYAILWGLMILSVARTTVLVRRRSTSEFASVDGSATLAILIVALLLGTLLINPRTRKVLASIRLGSPGVLLLYFSGAILSVLWSTLPSFSLFRAVEVMVIMGTAFVLMSRYDNVLEAEKVMLRVLMMVTVLAFLFRAINVGISVAGLHTNTYTVTAGAGMLYAFGESFGADKARRRMLRRWALAFLLFLAVGTSVGSNIAAALALLFMMTLLGFGRVILLPALLMGGVVLAILGSADDLLTNTILSGRDTSELANMTGRGKLWAAYFDGFLQRPLFGYGFAIGARIGDQFGVRATTNTHNGFIEALLGLGLFGILTLIVYFTRLFLELMFARRMQVPGAIGMIGAMAMVVVNNNSKSLIGGAYDPTLVGLFVMLGFFHFCVYQNARYVRHLRTQASAPPAQRRTAARNTPDPEGLPQ